jgi:hypothetical protein
LGVFEAEYDFLIGAGDGFVLGFGGSDFDDVTGSGSSLAAMSS